MELFEQENKPAQAASTISDLIDQLIETERFKEVNPIIEKAKQMYLKLKYNYKIDMLCLV